MEPHESAPEESGRDEHEEGNDVDEEMLAELFVLLDDGTPGGLIRACDMFLVGVPTALADLRGARAEARLDDAGRVAHNLRGTAGAFGAARLGRLAARLEEACGRSDGGSAGALVELMEGEFATFRTLLMSRLAVPGPA
jgi:HPt (histidine-containing phosphotransfer) domain-containing protein